VSAVKLEELTERVYLFNAWSGQKHLFITHKNAILRHFKVHSKSR
jgi:hypothetical protein